VAARNQLPPVADRARQLGLFADGYGLTRAERAILVTRMIEHAVRDAANELTDAGGLRMAKAPEGPSDPGWAVAWRLRSAAWLVRTKRLISWAGIVLVDRAARCTLRSTTRRSPPRVSARRRRPCESSPRIASAAVNGVGWYCRAARCHAERPIRKPPRFRGKRTGRGRRIKWVSGAGSVPPTHVARQVDDTSITTVSATVGT
jgi:hypothetical protein